MWWLQQHQLGSKNPETRRKVAAQLSERPTRAALRALTTATHDSDCEVRRLCVTALGKLDDPARFEPLLESLRDPEPAVIQTALSALKKLKDQRTTPAAVGLLRHPDAAVRGLAAQLLESHLWQPACEEDAAWFHVAQGQFTRAAAFGPLALDSLEHAIRHGPFSVALGGIRALAEVGGPRIARPLLAALKSTDAAVVIAAVETLTRTGLAEGTDHIARLLGHRDPHVRLAAAEALGSFRARATAPSLLPLLMDSSWDVRRAAVEALGRIRDPASLEPLCDALRDPDTDVREAATVALASQADPRAIPALVRALADSASGVRRLAAAALARLDDNWSERPEAKETANRLLTELGGQDVEAAYFLRQVLETRPTPPRARVQVFSRAEAPVLDPDQRRKLAANLFQNLLSDAEGLVRLAAAEALGRLRDPRSEGALVRALADPSAHVRNAAEQSIRLLRTN